MSVPRAFMAGIFAAIGGIAANLLTEFVDQVGLPNHLLAPAIVTVVLLLTLLGSAALQRNPGPPPDPGRRLLDQLEDRRRALYALRERCRTGNGWTAGCVEQWQQHQREITAIKAALATAGSPYRDESIDSSPAPNMSCLVRAALLARTATALLVVPIIGFSVALIASAPVAPRAVDAISAAMLRPKATPLLIARATPGPPPKTTATIAVIAQIIPSASPSPKSVAAITKAATRTASVSVSGTTRPATQTNVPAVKVTPPAVPALTRTPQAATQRPPTRVTTPTGTPRPADPLTQVPSKLDVPVLAYPEDGASASGPTDFEWQWNGPALTNDQGFEVRVWKEGQPSHYGAADIVAGDVRKLRIDLASSYGWQQGGNGLYFWTVAVVQRTPYLQIRQEAPARRIDIAITR